MQMTREEWREFMLESPRTGKIATVRADGRPHIAPIWYHLDGDTIVFNTGEETVKGRNLRRDPRATICVDDEAPPYAFSIVEGGVEFLDDPDQLRHWATLIGGRYMGEDRAEEFGERNGVPGEMLLRLEPRKIIAERGVAD